MNKNEILQHLQFDALVGAAPMLAELIPDDVDALAIYVSSHEIVDDERAMPTEHDRVFLLTPTALHCYENIIRDVNVADYMGHLRFQRSGHTVRSTVIPLPAIRRIELFAETGVHQGRGAEPVQDFNLHIWVNGDAPEVTLPIEGDLINREIPHRVDVAAKVRNFHAALVAILGKAAIQTVVAA